jgi:hypothetical protein
VYVHIRQNATAPNLEYFSQGCTYTLPAGSQYEPVRGKEKRKKCTRTGSCAADSSKRIREECRDVLFVCCGRETPNVHPPRMTGGLLARCGRSKGRSICEPDTATLPTAATSYGTETPRGEKGGLHHSLPITCNEWFPSFSNGFEQHMGRAGCLVPETHQDYVHNALFMPRHF